MTVDVTKGIGDKIPIEGIHMLLANDLAGGHVSCGMRKSILVGDSDLHPECVVTRVMAKKAKRESQNHVTDVQVDSDGDMTLPETVYSAWCEPVSLETIPMYRMWCRKWSSTLI